MARKVLVKHTDGTSYDLTEAPAPNEEQLQEVMKEHPVLLPVDDLGISGPLLVVGRETRLASGSIDLVGVVPSGDVILVEFKTGPQNPDFRHALAQLIDYGSDLWGTSVAKFDDGVVQRYLTSSRCPAEYKALQSLQEFVQFAWASLEFDWELFVERLAYVLQEGDFHYVVAAQRFTPQMTRSLDYLNRVVGLGEYHLVQMIQLNGADTTAYSAQVVTPRSKTPSASSKSVTSQTAFLADIEDGAYREALKDLFAVCSTLGLSFEWGSKGTSIRLPTADRSEPLSIGWAFPEGHHFKGLRHLSLGYDTASAQSTPSVATALSAYADKLAEVPGGIPAKGKKLQVWTWQPSQVPGVKDLLVAALEALVQAASGDEPGESTPSPSP